MQLKRLQGLEHEKIDEEYNQLMKIIEELKSILADENKLFDVIKNELLVIKEKFNDARRTQIIQNPGEIDIEDLIEEEASVIAKTSLNYIKRTPLATYKSQNRGGRGILGMQTREEDDVTRLFVCSTHDFLLFFTNFGRVYKIKGYEVPEAGRTARGLAIVNLLSISQGEMITAVVPVRSFDENRYLVMITRNGIIKKTDMQSFSNIRKAGLTAVNLRDSDELIAVFITDGTAEILVATRNGMGIKFNEGDVRPMGRTATGVKAITLSDDDYVISADIIKENDKILNVTENGYGKRTDALNFNVQYRGGKGVKIHQLTDKTGPLSGVVKVSDNEELMIVTSEGIIIRLRGKEISTFGRISQGVKLINFREGITVAGVAKIDEDDIISEEEVETEETNE
ncbi:DNA gyrase subunit A [bioreactor metagenome]|uniref:DNA gyrase subunit A n=1 Tax=bioreactor metagenome TaxID=1076179 RepID=A0A645AUU2_9ZZZZ